MFIPNNFLLRSCMILFFLILGFYFCSLELKSSTDKDPSYIVIDEVLGIWISLLLINSVWLSIIGFILFRIFDILKPSIIYHSQFLKGATGVMMDDIIAGIFVSLILLGITV